MSGVMPYPEPYHQDAAIAGQAAALLASYVAEGHGGPDRPFALVCSFHGPHFPIEVPEPYASLYDPAAVPRFASFDDTFEGKPQGQRTHPWLQLAPISLGAVAADRSLLGLRHLHRRADGSRPGHLGGQRCRADLVLATADHGEMARHHRMFDKGPYFYERATRAVRLALAGPCPARANPARRRSVTWT
jgi:arylsulfatase A-like enzyme